MNLRECGLMLIGNLRVVVRNGERRIVEETIYENTIQTGLYRRIPFILGIAQSGNAPQIACYAIDYSMTSGAGQWETGTYPTKSAGGTFNETYVTHTNSYTAASTKTVRRLRMRRYPNAFSANDVDADVMLSLITGLTIALQTGWSIETSWTLRTA